MEEFTGLDGILYMEGTNGKLAYQHPEEEFLQFTTTLNLKSPLERKILDRWIKYLKKNNVKFEIVHKETDKTKVTIWVTQKWWKTYKYNKLPGKI